MAQTVVTHEAYTPYVEATARTLMQRGTDRYGTTHRDILVSILDVSTLNSPANPLALDEGWRVSRRDRRSPGGTNLAMDMQLLDSMYLLSERQEDMRYANFADGYIRYTAANLLDTGRENKGFIWWGWHRWVNVHDEFRKSSAEGDYHELQSTFPVRWDRLWAVNPTVAQKQADAAWQWHVVNKTTGEINRHGDGQVGHAFSMSTGEFVSEFTQAYLSTGNQLWLDRAKLLAQRHWDKRNPSTNLTPEDASSDTAARFDRSHFLTSTSGPFVRSLLNAYDATGETSFRNQAVAYLKAYDTYGFDAASGKYYGSINLNGTPVPGPRIVPTPGTLPGADMDRQYQVYEPRGYLDLWQPYIAGTEHPLETAHSYVYAYDVTGDPRMLAGARRFATWIENELPSKQWQSNTWYDYLANQANWSNRKGEYAQQYAQLISIFSYLYAVTGEEHYLDVARGQADESLAKLFVTTTINGQTYELLKGHPDKPYYEQTDGVGFLMRALIDLDRVGEDRQVLLAERSVIAVPEPTASAIAGAAGALLGLRRRRLRDGTTAGITGG